MKLTIKKGSTSKIVHLFLSDSAATDGSGKTGILYSDVTGYYMRPGDLAPTAITMATATIGTYASGGFIEIDAANMPGIYEFSIPDACLASGADQVVIMLKGVGFAPLPLEIQLDDNTSKDIYDRVGAPAGASVSADIADIPTVAEFEARTILAADYFDPAVDTVANVTTVATLTGHTPQSGDTFAQLPANFSVLSISAGGAVTNVNLVDTCTANTDMRGTDDAALASICTETRLAELDAANIPTDIANIKSDTAAILVDTGTDGVLLAGTATSAQLVDDFWDELLTGSEHNLPTSAGRRLRELSSPVLLEGTSPGLNNTSTRIELDAAASSTDGAYDPAVICIYEGTGAGQSRQIFEYDGTNKYAYINRDWKTIPDSTSKYLIFSSAGDTHVNEGVAQGGTTNSITLNALASSSSDIYKGQVVFIVAGTGADQAKRIANYDGTTKVATISPDWAVPPDTTSVYAILPTALCDSESVEAIKAKTDNLPASPAAIGSEMALTDGAITSAKYDGTTAKPTVNDISSTDVNTEVSDVLKVDTVSEMAQGAPPVDPTFEQILNYIYRQLRNKVETTSTETATYDDSGTTKLFKAQLSDDGTTFTKGELISGL